MRHFHGVAVLVALACCLGLCTVVQAVVQTIDATTRSTVLQFLPGDVVNSDTSFESLDLTTSNLPLVADARLSQFDPDNVLLSAATAVTIFSDPRASETEDPDEFAFDLVAFSLDPVVDYDATGTATETRSITFTREEIGAADGTELRVTSHFFLDGFMVIWGDLDASLGDTAAKVRLRVYQERAGQDRTLLMESMVSLSLNADSTPLVVAEGALTTDYLVFVDTLGSLVPLGDAYLVALPPLSIPYSYDALVGENFTLSAEVECRASNQPYTGAGLALGVPLEQFLATIGQIVGDELKASQVFRETDGIVPKAARSLEETGTTVRVVGGGDSTLARVLPCGGLGIEALVIPAGLSAAFFFVGRRRR